MRSLHDRLLHGGGVFWFVLSHQPDVGRRCQKLPGGGWRRQHDGIVYIHYIHTEPKTYMYDYQECNSNVQE